MDAKRVVSIVGARPQFVKAAMLGRALAGCRGVEHLVLHTGQHYDDNLSAVFFGQLEMDPPDSNLAVGSGPQGRQTGRMLEGIEQYLQERSPAGVVVYGDTNSTLAGALAAVKLHLPLAHVEAGLRSFNRLMPEEINRVLTDHCADLLFAPTGAAVANLAREGLTGGRVFRTGDVMLDAALLFAKKAEAESTILQRLDLTLGGYVLATVHRAENTDNTARLTAIAGGLTQLARDRPVVLPLHPRTKTALRRDGLLEDLGQVLRLVEPLGYLDMAALEKNAALVATDSGGVQKEAYFYRVPCVTLREETEWVELVEAGWNRLCPPRSGAAVYTALTGALGSSGEDIDLYGDGNAAEEIAALLVRHL